MQAQAQASRRQFEHRFREWQRCGMSVRAASVLAYAACDTVEEVRYLGKEYFKGLDNVGRETLSEIVQLAGLESRPVSPEDAATAALQLAIGDKEEAREVARDVLMSLRRAGFVISARVVRP